MSNPALRNNPAFSGKTMSAEELRQMYDASAAAPPAQKAEIQKNMPVEGASDDPMTYEDTIHKTAALLGTTIAAAAVGWIMPGLLLVGVIGGLVFGLIQAFKREPNLFLIFGYAVLQGVALGAISGILNASYPGIVSQALIGTLSVFGVMLLLFRSGKVRTSPKMTKIVLGAMLGYFVFSMVNFVLMLTGVTTDAWGLRTGVEIFGIPLGVVIGILAILLASYSLVMDFEFVKNGVESRVPRRYGWMAAYGLTVTLIWLYMEILRLLAIFRD
ncbi:Bax inhibitor-1/YccA family protein [Leucobacter chinensis]|uniref:Bax inhibitor-1/YccA family protein n=1 Tax=Leucobacter chinensis TaxID=2851010 RepID=UPI001C21D0ED|nr:Bax inhibitor-1/YccA family protein [Leucobacter chinensis]